MNSIIFNQLKLTTGFVLNVTESWQTIQLPYVYERMVLITTPMYTRAQANAVVRTKNVNNSNSFDMRAENPTGDSVNQIGVFYIAAEEGVFADANSGIKIEATQSIITGNDVGRSGVTYTFRQTYTNPIVVGSVMSSEGAWSTFFAKDVTPTNATIGRLIGNDPNTDRADENLGIIVIEAGTGEINGIQFLAGQTGNSVSNTRAGGRYRQTFDFDPITAVVSPATLNEDQDYWPLLYGNTHNVAFGPNDILITVDEDQFNGNDRIHESESVYYLILNGQNEASRFLIQAGFGGDMVDLEQVSLLGIANWIDAQKGASRHQVQDHFRDITPLIAHHIDVAERNKSFPFRYVVRGEKWVENVSTAWMRGIVHSDDQLRQRVTWTLSQIFVVGFSSLSRDRYMGLSYSDYYDALSLHALGSFRDLLMAITLHPLMGRYLTYQANAKASDDGLVQPDENYAREIMQLFTIGLWELNIDGSRKLDNNGEPIPTYNGNDISALARIFTGMTIPNLAGRNNLDIPGIAEGTVRAYSEAAALREDPAEMTMFDHHHDTKAKTVFQGKAWEETFPDRSDMEGSGAGMADLNQVIDMLVNHPNTPPFICRALIQFLVTSNPSPSYIERIATVFVDNGNGERGDLFAVARAILLDEDARFYALGEDNIYHGKLLEPLIRFTRMVKAFNAGADLESDDFSDLDNPKYNDIYWTGGNFGGQQPLKSPSVFNFFLPHYKPGGSLTTNNGEQLFAPEMQIYDASTAMLIANNLITLLENGLGSGIKKSTNGEGPNVPFNWETELAMIDDIDALLSRLDTLLCGGLMSDGTLNTLTKSLTNASAAGLSAEERLRIAIYGTMISPDSAVLV